MRMIFDGALLPELDLGRLVLFCRLRQNGKIKVGTVAVCGLLAPAPRGLPGRPDLGCSPSGPARRRAAESVLGPACPPSPGAAGRPARGQWRAPASGLSSLSAAWISSCATPRWRSSAPERPACQAAAMVARIHPGPGEHGVVDQLHLGEPGKYCRCRRLRHAAPPQRVCQLCLRPGRCRQHPQADLARDRLRIGVGPGLWIMSRHRRPGSRLPGRRRSATVPAPAVLARSPRRPAIGRPTRSAGSSPTPAPASRGLRSGRRPRQPRHRSWRRHRASP